MIVKLVGSVMILLSCIGAARALTAREKEKNDQITAFIALIKYIRDRIDCYSIPIDKILSECPEEMLSPLGGREGAISFGGILERKSLLVDGEARRILEEFSETLGKNYRERQIKLCDSALSSLDSVRDAEAKKYAIKKKTVNALCLAVGGMVIILLL